VLQPEDFFLPPQKLREEGPAFEDCNLEKIEKLIIRRAITKHGGNISQAAQELGLSRASLYRRLEKYGL
jgi:transcriptional regulator of acetoin/glycerol metabolism